MMDLVTEISNKHPTECISKGFVGSAATFPAFACRKRFASDLSVFLLHPPSKSGVHGQPKELQIHSDNLDIWHDVSLGAYKKLSRESAYKGSGDGGGNSAGAGGSSGGEKMVLGSGWNGSVGGSTGGSSSNTSETGESSAKLQFPGFFGWDLIRKSFEDNRYSRAEAVKRMGLIDGIRD